MIAHGLVIAAIVFLVVVLPSSSHALQCRTQEGATRFIQMACAHGLVSCPEDMQVYDVSSRHDRGHIYLFPEPEPTGPAVVIVVSNDTCPPEDGLRARYYAELPHVYVDAPTVLLNVVGPDVLVLNGSISYGPGGWACDQMDFTPESLISYHLAARGLSHRQRYDIAKEIRRVSPLCRKMDEEAIVYLETEKASVRCTTYHTHTTYRIHVRRLEDTMRRIAAGGDDAIYDIKTNGRDYAFEWKGDPMRLEQWNQLSYTLDAQLEAIWYRWRHDHTNPPQEAKTVDAPDGNPAILAMITLVWLVVCMVAMCGGNCTPPQERSSRQQR